MRSRSASLLLFILSVASFFTMISRVQSRDNGSQSSRSEGEIVQEMVRDLQSQNESDQIRAAQALGEMGSAAESAEPVLVRVIKTGNPTARVVASIALLKIDPTMMDMIPILLRGLEKEGQEGQDIALGKELGLQEDMMHKWSSLMRSKVDPKILPLLVQTLNENNKDIRILGVLVLGGITAQVPEALPYILKAYEDPDKDVRAAVFGVLVRIGPKMKGVVPAILKGTKDPDPEVRLRAVLAMGRLGPGVKEVIPALLSGLEDKDPQVRAAALKALESFGPAAKEAVPAVAARMGQGGPEERLAVAATLLKIDSSQSGRVVPLLILMLKDPSLGPPARLRAADLLEQSGSAAQGEIPALAKILADPNAEIRNRVSQLLSRIGPAAVPALTRSMQDANVNIRLAAMQALSGMSPLPPELIPLLTGALEDKDRSLRYLAAEGLGNLGVLARGAIPALFHALKDSEESVRTSAGNALLRMGSAALPALTEASHDPVIGPRVQILLKRTPRESS